MRLRREDVPSFDAYPFSLPAVRALDTLALHPRVTFLVGENGSGKSTLLEALAVALGFNPEGGSRSFRFGTRPSHSELHRYLRVARVGHPRDGYFFRAESFFNVATEIERLDEGGGGAPVSASYGDRPLHEQSHGEAFLALLQHRFGAGGLYLLDEPEAALSPQRLLAALVRIHELVRAGSQFVVATHSPLLLAYPDALIYLVDGGAPRAVRYDETEHYRVARDFLANPSRLLKALLEPGGDPSSPQAS